MKLEAGDKVNVRNARDDYDTQIYTVIEVHDEYVKLKHPDIGGYFQFKRDRIEVINEGG